MKSKIIFLCLITAFSLPIPAFAQDGSRLEKWRELREHRQEGKRRTQTKPEGVITDNYEGREILVHVATNAPPANRALVIVLHGGMGNANHIFSILGEQLNGAANEGGFVVAYLNGSPATRRGENGHNAWNAGGGCCGQPFAKNIDDVAYISRAITYLADKYNVDKNKVSAIGHSNGAMMTQRLMCETDLLQSAIPISGPLMLHVKTCPKAGGKKILAIHGELDENVPINGGYGTKGVTNIKFAAQSQSKAVFEASGAEYTIDEVKGVDHSLAAIVDAVGKRQERNFGQEAALFLGLAPKY